MTAYYRQAEAKTDTTNTFGWKNYEANIVPRSRVSSQSTVRGIRPASRRSSLNVSWSLQQLQQTTTYGQSVDQPDTNDVFHTINSFDLPWRQWSLLNCFHTEQSHCGACKKKWNQAVTELCLCDESKQCPTLSTLVLVEVEWQLVATTLCWQWSRCLADQLRLLKHTQEEHLQESSMYIALDFKKSPLVFSSSLPQMWITCNRNFSKCAICNKL